MKPCTFRYYWYALFAVLGLVALFIVGWIVDIARRPIVNAQGLKGALDARSRSKAGLSNPKDAEDSFQSALKVRMPKQFGSDEGRDLYPLDTNLLKTPVAGIGVQLHFNFQLLRCRVQCFLSLYHCHHYQSVSAGTVEVYCFVSPMVSQGSSSSCGRLQSAWLG